MHLPCTTVILHSDFMLSVNEGASKKCMQLTTFQRLSIVFFVYLRLQVNQANNMSMHN